MNFKLPKPEDYTEKHKDYSYQLANAYADIRGDFGIALIELSSVKDALNETGKDKESIIAGKKWALGIIEEILKRHSL